MTTTIPLSTTTQPPSKPKPWLNNDPKPWHNKDASTRDHHPIDKVVVIEAKRPASSPRGGGGESTGEEEHVVFSCVGAELVVLERVARISGLVCSILDSPGDYIEKQTRTIRLDHISAAVLKEVIHFCTQECQENSSFLQSLPSPSRSPRGTQEGTYIGNKDEKVLRTSFVFELKPETVMELMSAAEYLQIPSLISHIINMLAAYADDLPSFAGMSEDLVEQVCNKCKPHTLRKIEIDGKLEIFEKDFTTPIWKRFCGEYEDVVVLNRKECRAREFAYSKYSNNGDNNNNNINTNNNNNIKNEYREDNKSTSNSVWNGEVDWRRGYAELTLEKIMSRIAPESQQQIDAELQAFGSIFGDLVSYLRLYHGQLNALLLSSSCPNIKFLEIIGHIGFYESQISTLVTHLPSIRYLRISNSDATEGFWMEFLESIGKANIMELDISNNDLKPKAALSVARLVHQNRNIRMLNMANNPIEIQGFIAIANAAANLQALDASDCAIATGPQSEEVLHRTPILTHDLKVLKLSGNSFVKVPGLFWQYILSAQKRLERLEMARVMWVHKDKDIRVLIRHIAELPRIEYVDLSDNNIEELGMEAICFNLLLAHLAPLKTLVLTGNSVKDTIAAGFARALRYNTSLQRLVLPHVTDYGLMELDQAVSQNPASAMTKIIVASRKPLSLSLPLTCPHLFTCDNIPDPTHTYQMRWNPRPY